MQDIREQQRIITRWENSRLNPPDDDYEPIQVCDFCDNEAEYEINHELFCSRCMEQEFRIRR